jgi:hypothetical protein
MYQKKITQLFQPQTFAQKLQKRISNLKAILAVKEKTFLTARISVKIICNSNEKNMEKKTA